MKKLKIAVLALQGAFVEHEQMLTRMGIDWFEVRQYADWQQPKDGLIIPGGESTTMRKLLHESGLFTPIRDALSKGLPVFGTCAGLILLAKSVNGDEDNRTTFPTLGVMDIDVERNAYGRQLGSFSVEVPIQLPQGGGTLAEKTIPMTFIRAPFINKVSGDAVALAQIDGHIVAALEGRKLVTAFHPELTDNTLVHEAFIRLIEKGR